MYKSHGMDPVVKYIVDNSLRLDDVRKSLIDETVKLGPSSRMLGSADSLQLLANLCRLMRARKTLDIGMFTGYSALAIAQVLPADGRVVTCDVSARHEPLAREHWRRAGVESRIDFRLGPATETLRALAGDPAEAGSFDFAFVDADKTGYAEYYELCLRLIRPGGLIAFDNVLWGGSVLNEADQSPDTCALRQLSRRLKTDERVDVSILSTGDGVALAFVK